MTERRFPQVVIVGAAVCALAIGLFLALRNRGLKSDERQGSKAVEAGLAGTVSHQPKAIGSGNSGTSGSGESLALSQTRGSDLRGEKLRIAVQEMNVPLVLFGTVVGESDEPLSGVKVQVSVRRWRVTPEFDADATFSRKEAVTDREGHFQLDCERGDALTIEAVEKDGYEVEKPVRGFTYTASDLLQGDAKGSIVLHMWKLGKNPTLSKGNQRYSLVPDGRIYTIDLMAGRIAESASAEGDFRVRMRRAPDAAWGQRFSWSLEIQAPDGGLAEETNASSTMFRAPEHGYTNAWKWESPAYGYYLQDKQGWLNITWTMNLAGERLLR